MLIGVVVNNIIVDRYAVSILHSPISSSVSAYHINQVANFNPRIDAEVDYVVILSIIADWYSVLRVFLVGISVDVVTIVHTLLFTKLAHSNPLHVHFIYMS